MFSFNQAKIDYEEPVSLIPGSVFAYHESSEDKRWLVKIAETKTPQDFLTSLHQLIVGFNCDHSTILPIKGYDLQYNEDSNSWKLFMKMPRVERTLKDFIDKHTVNDPITEEILINYLYPITSGLSYLHAKKVAHRDLEPSNILLDAEDCIKIGNFCPNPFEREQENSCDVQKDLWAPWYIAPELRAKREQLLEMKRKELIRADCWSLGMTILSLCLREKEAIQEISVLEDDEIVRKKVQEKLQGRYNDVLVCLISDLLRLNPEERISSAQVQQALETHFSHLIKPTNLSLFTPDHNAPKIEEEKTDQAIDPKLKLETVINEMEKDWKGKFSGEIEDEFRISRIWLRKVEDQQLLELMKDFTAKLKARDLLQLKQLRLFMDGCKKITDFGIKGLAERLAMNLQSLIYLDLDLRNCIQLTDEGVKSIGKQIGPNLNKLRHLNLNFDNCDQITDNGVNGLADEIGLKLKSLEHLFLSFEGCVKLTDDAIKHLSLVVINKLPALQTINLDFRRCNNISDESVRELFKEPNSSIQHVILDFMNCDHITNGGIAELAHYISINLPNLLNFSMKMRECSQITDKGIKVMAENIGKLEKLQCFCIEFQLCKNITDQGIKDLAIQIGSNLRTLQYLQLAFPRCQEISDEGVGALSSSIEQLVHLQHLALNFSDCEKISDSVFYKLSQSVIQNNLGRLKSLFLDFDSCSRIKEATKQSAFTEISAKHLSQLHIR